MSSSEQQHIFLSYAREDSEVAVRITRDLANLGFTVWFDKEDLRAGTHWKSAIQRAIRNSTLFIPILSKQALDKRGYFQRELKAGLEVLQEFPRHRRFIIPVRIDNCDVLDPELADHQWIDLFENYNRGFQKLLRSIEEIIPRPDPPKDEASTDRSATPQNERASLLAEFLHTANDISKRAAEIEALEPIRAKANTKAKQDLMDELAHPIWTQIEDSATRLQDQLQKIDLLCSSRIGMVATHIAAIGLIWKASRTQSREKREEILAAFEDLSSVLIPRFKLNSRIELGMHSEPYSQV